LLPTKLKRKNNYARSIYDISINKVVIITLLSPLPPSLPFSLYKKVKSLFGFLNIDKNVNNINTEQKNKKEIKENKNGEQNKRKIWFM